MVATGGQKWQPKIIRRFIKSFATSTEVVLVETDQGRGYLKALGNKTGPHALACEWVGTNLATLLGLPTLDFAIIEIGEDDEIPLASGNFALPGPAFITRAEKGFSWGGKASELKKIANPKDIGRLVLFDTWLLNCDRYHPNLAVRKPNRDNVFLSREGAPRSKFVIKAIDHTHCFTCGGELTHRLAQINQVRDERTYGLFPEFEEFLTRADMRRAVSDLQKINRTDVQALVDTIPVGWQVNKQVRDALVNFICDRVTYLIENFVSRRWSQGELELC
jgi:hypothetical protein